MLAYWKLVSLGEGGNAHRIVCGENLGNASECRRTSPRVWPPEKVTEPELYGGDATGQTDPHQRAGRSSPPRGSTLVHALRR